MSPKSNFELLVIGAGAAGLAAASTLARAGCTVTVVEARSRVGGRVSTIREPSWGGVIEAGAEFVHGDAEETEAIAKRAEVTFEDLEGKHATPRDGALSPIDLSEPIEKISRLYPRGNAPDTSFADVLARCDTVSDRERLHLQAYIEGFEAADADRISARWLAEAEAETGQGSGIRRPRGGYNQLLDSFLPAEGQSWFDLRLRSRVTAIRWQRGAAHVTLEDGVNLSATAAVITLPIGVLSSREIASRVVFDPEIPEKRRAWSSLAVGSVVKTVFAFRTLPWSRSRSSGGTNLSNISFLHTPAGPFLAWWVGRTSPNPVIVGWSGGPRAEKLSLLGDGEILDEAIRALSVATGQPREALDADLLHAAAFNWQTDPFSRGAYTYVPVGGLDLPKMLAAPVEDTLFFAGEATDLIHMGTVEGALRSGRRAAEQILAARAMRGE